MDKVNITVFVLLICSFSIMSVSGDVSKCITDYTQKIQGLSGPSARSQICAPLKEMMAACIFRESGLTSGTITPEKKKQMQTQLTSSMSQQNINCDFDVDSILREVDSGGSPGGGSGEVTGMAKCMQNMMNEIRHITDKSDPRVCPAATKMTKCMLDLQHVDARRLSEGQKKILEQQMNQLLGQQGINCDITVDQIIASEGFNTGSPIKAGYIIWIMATFPLLLWGKYQF